MIVCIHNSMKRHSFSKPVRSILSLPKDANPTLVHNFSQTFGKKDEIRAAFTTASPLTASEIPRC